MEMHIRYVERLDGLKYALAAVLGGLLLIPLWIVRYPPLVDYPNHLARAFVLAHLTDPRFHFSRFYIPDWGPYPYVLADVLTSAIQHIMGIGAAGHIILSLCVLSMPLAAWFFLRRANPGSESIALWVLLIVYNRFVLMGFISSELSVALCLITVGFWLDYLDSPRFSKWCLLSLLATLTYLTHLIGFAAAGLIVTTYGFVTRRSFREIFNAWLAFLPGAALYIYAKLSLRAVSSPTLGGVPNVRDIGSLDFHWKLAGLIYPMRGYSKLLDLFTLVILAGCILAVLWKNPSHHWDRRWLAVAAVVFALYWIIPGRFSDGGFVDVRLTEYLFILVLAAIRIGSRKRMLIAAALALFAIRMVDLSYHFVQEDRRLEALATSFSAIPAGARVMPLVRRDQDATIPYAQRGEVHLWAYGIIGKGWLSPALFHMNGVQPIRLRQDIYCVKAGCTPLVDREPDWRQVSRDYDYVWAYDLPEYHSQLAAIGNCVFSEGRLSVFQMNRVSDDSGAEVRATETPGSRTPMPRTSTSRLR